MPKGKRRANKHERNRYENTSDDDSYNNGNANPENASTTSGGYSENRSTDDGGYEVGAAASPVLVAQQEQQIYEDKLFDCLDGCVQKSSQGRTNCIRTLSQMLAKKYTPNFALDRAVTICDIVERSLKKGGGGERAAAAELATILCVQLGVDETITTIEKTLRPILLALAGDKTVSPETRAKCCTAVGGVVFLADADLADTLATMQQLEAIFAGGYLKCNIKTVDSTSAEMAQMHAAALSSWCLLLTTLGGQVASLIHTNSLPSMEQLVQLLDSPHLDVRLTCGEALALIFEDGRRDAGVDYAEVFADQISDVMRKLATDSHKYRAKKERKQQRATFRDILKYIEEDGFVEIQVRFGREVLSLSTWSKRKQYDWLCALLGGGLNAHLVDNDLLREVFELGDAPIQVVDEHQMHARDQWERCRKRLLNAANFKARTLSRAKNRDKRADF